MNTLVLIAGGANGSILSNAEIFTPLTWHYGYTLSSVASNSVTNSSAVISWFTNLPADSYLEYGFDTSYLETPIETPALTQKHTVALSGLAYHYSVNSMDVDSTQVFSGDFTFTTNP